MLTCKEYTDLRKKELKEYIEEKGLHPKLVVVEVGDRPESNSYIRGKMRDCKEVGIECIVKKYPDNIKTDRLIDRIGEALRETKAHGLIVQLPLPDHIDVKEVQSWIPEMKDVDGFGSDSPFDPCTPKGVIGYLKYIGYEFEGKDALVIGRSPIVGKPLADMLTDLDCTVTLAHSKTKNLYDRMRDFDIVFTAIDKIEYFCGALTIGKKIDLIDIGLGIGVDGKLHGNWNHLSINTMKCYLREDQVLISGTGGVGLLTRLALLENVVKAAELCDNANG
jgi:methylenetetrahydrofolate dehydrogenase (NADP+)/methenyltetrahydrofolate cyclohydrolase